MQRSCKRSRSRHEYKQRVAGVPGGDIGDGDGGGADGDTRTRRRCRESVRSGAEFGLCCVGSSIGLMALFVAVSVMSIAWMSVIAAVGLAQKLLPANAAVDVPLALAIIGLGLLIVITPSSIPGLMPPM